MHTVKINIDDSIYNHVMFLLQNLNYKGLEIVEEKKIDSGQNTKDLVMELFKSKKMEFFKKIDDPLEWQRSQRNQW